MLYWSKFRTYFLTLLLVIGSVTLLTAQNIQHKVQDEETLFSIAQKYDVTVQQLKAWNNLTSNAISIGQKLVIKKKKSEGTYTVKRDDTLFSIARQFNVSVNELKKWNHLRNSTLAIGATLTVHPQNKQDDEIETVSTKVIPANPDGYYSVKSGDTLFRIAKIHNMEVERLKELNNLASNNIHVGQELKIEGTVSVSSRIRNVRAKPGAVILYELKSGMTVNDFLKMFEMNINRFKQLNPGMKATYLNEGQIVRVVVPKTENNESQAEQGVTILGRTAALKYSAGRRGTTTTNGELYNPRALTAAHKSMAIGSVIFVKNPANNRGVIIRVNDRMTEQGLKLSKAAWQALGLSKSASNLILYKIDE